LTPLPIDDYDYDLPEERIARFPLPERDASQLLLYRGGAISSARFSSLAEQLPPRSLLVFNDTRVIRARIVFFKETGARIEIFCLEPLEPADYERAFAQKGSCLWRCMVGNSKKWKEGTVSIAFEHAGKPCRLTAARADEGGEADEREPSIRFEWDADLAFGQLLELLGRIPIPPYLNRESEESDNTRYQTVYSRWEGSVAAPTAGLHFTDRILEDLRARGMGTEKVTLHVGAGTFLPVKSDDARSHSMHTEHFEVTTATIQKLSTLTGPVVAVGTTSVRTLESLTVLGYRIMQGGSPDADRPVGQWEAYEIPEALSGTELLRALANWLESNGLKRLKSSTRIMITPGGFHFRVVEGLITNFHQPKSTLLLLISAFVGEDWRRIYRYALEHDFRFLSYGDSSLLLRQ
jgi:S-adenosylmethionine:tRNA ribosyltransferase-isomerase